jgi:hypothetical protein
MARSSLLQGEPRPLQVELEGQFRKLRQQTLFLLEELPSEDCSFSRSSNHRDDSFGILGDMSGNDQHAGSHFGPILDGTLQFVSLPSRCTPTIAAHPLGQQFEAPTRSTIGGSAWSLHHTVLLLREGPIPTRRRRTTSTRPDSLSELAPPLVQRESRGSVLPGMSARGEGIDGSVQRRTRTGR